MGKERLEALEEEVARLLKCGFIREEKIFDLVPKPNGKWRTCIDFSDLNKVCPEDCFPLPRIDQLVDATVSHEIISFMDAYSGYNQIAVKSADQEHTKFMIEHNVYYYKVMPFELENAGATYHTLVTEMFVS